MLKIISLPSIRSRHASSRCGKRSHLTRSGWPKRSTWSPVSPSRRRTPCFSYSSSSTTRASPRIRSASTCCTPSTPTTTTCCNRRITHTKDTHLKLVNFSSIHTFNSGTSWTKGRHFDNIRKLISSANGEASSKHKHTHTTHTSRITQVLKERNFSEKGIWRKTVKSENGK